MIGKKGAALVFEKLVKYIIALALLVLFIYLLSLVIDTGNAFFGIFN